MHHSADIDSSTVSKVSLVSGKEELQGQPPGGQPWRRVTNVVDPSTAEFVSIVALSEVRSTRACTE